MSQPKLRAWVVCLSAVVVAISQPQPISAAIPDKKLEAALRSVIFDKKDSTAELTDDDLKKVFVLEARGKGISDLTGLEKCINLQLLNLAKNEVKDVTAVKSLTNLLSLDLSENKIVDVEPLSTLKGVQFLELSKNEIEKAAPLAALEKLSALYIANNKITDAAPFAKLKRLSSLDLAGNRIGDLTPISELKGLSLLKLSENELTDLSKLQIGGELKMLILDKNKIADLGPLVTAVEADAKGPMRVAPFLRLYLAGNPLGDAAKNVHLPTLKKLGVKVFLGEPGEKP